MRVDGFCVVQHVTPTPVQGMRVDDFCVAQHVTPTPVQDMPLTTRGFDQKQTTVGPCQCPDTHTRTHSKGHGAGHARRRLLCCTAHEANTAVNVCCDIVRDL